MRNTVITAALLAFVSTVFGQQSKLASRDLAYRLQPSDVLEVEYVFTPEYNQVAAIEPDGTVRLKVVGPVKVAGLSLDEATAAVIAKASIPLNSPELTLTLKEYVKPHFTVYGEVARPGIYDIHGKVTLLQAVAMSGGVKDVSKESKVLLVRQVNAEFAEVKVVNTRFLSSAKGVQEDVTLQPNDMLIIPKNLLGKVEPYVRIASQGLTSLYGVQVFK